MTSASMTPERSSTPSPILDPVSPLSPISPWPPLPSASSASLHGADPKNIQLDAALPNATDVYSSIAILGTYLLFGLYLLWAFSPKDTVWLSWLPDRQWAIIVPCWLMMVVLLTYWSYAALTIYRTPSWDSVDCITDPYAGIPSMRSSSGFTKDTKAGTEQSRTPYYWNIINDRASSEAVDLPIDLIGRVLYSPRKRKGF
ncbi:uncharacterized protein I303_101610 [Kwoniella dejecticola CBS 10117]|uniref:Phosphatidylinositol glycan, class P n=1 Tax=Kwoniella dejecticola CBS 10117 TaxID=1296121 RepID=A0A1A6AD95_9TREE|nr:phosphatidylinositol glycan, class P [Kwoniella dejecticola CBS 10117]OBR88037.1 phosphatidylinositol glycan, class P [Kwoniella dejecticola CBS 10117]